MNQLNPDLQTFFASKQNLWIQHGLFWLFVVISTVTFGEYPPYLRGLEVVCFMFQFIFFMAIPGYVNNIFVLPLFKERRIFRALAFYVTQILVLTLALPYLFMSISEVFRMLFGIRQWANWHNENIAFNVLAFTVMASIINVAREKFILEKAQKEAELYQLREQLNPHFLFNTLNNLYGMSVLQSPKLPDLMLKLSDLLRYSLYETNQTLVPLEKELLYIRNYIELEKIRLEERTIIECTMEGDFSGHTIAPLMLILFIENSFKHHTAKRNEQGLIKIDITINNGAFSMTVLNSMDPLFNHDSERKRVGGIGMANVKKRLNLLYSNKYSLNFDRQPDLYKVDLQIDLNQ